MIGGRGWTVARGRRWGRVTPRVRDAGGWGGGRVGHAVAIEIGGSGGREVRKRGPRKETLVIKDENRLDTGEYNSSRILSFNFSLGSGVGADSVG